LAAAVPDVQISGVTRPVRRARPSAKYAADRSSSWEKQWSSWCRSAAIVSGVDRLPGETTTASTPEATSSSTIARAHSVFRFGAVISGRTRAANK